MDGRFWKHIKRAARLHYADTVRPALFGSRLRIVDLPVEVLEQCFLFLTPADIYSCTLVRNFLPDDLGDHNNYSLGL